MVCRCDMIVLVHLEAFHRVIAREAELVQLFQNVLLKNLHVSACGPRWHRWDLNVPHMRPDLRGIQSLGRLSGEHACDEISCACREKVWALILSSQDLLVQSCSVLVLKGQIATQHCKEDHAAAPDVTE